MIMFDINIRNKFKINMTKYAKCILVGFPKNFSKDAISIISVNIFFEIDNNALKIENHSLCQMKYH